MNKVNALQLVEYFINNGYGRITIITSGGPVKEKSDYEYWLASIDHPEYVAIRISSDNQQKRNDSQETLQLIYEKLVAGQEDKRGLLDISLSDDGQEYSVGKIDYVAASLEKPFNLKTETIFPGINEVLKPVENTENNIKIINKRIRKKDFRVLRKTNIKERLKEISPVYGIVSAICIVVLLALTLMSLLSETDVTTTAIFFGAYYKAYISVLNQWFRLLTCGFIHCDFIHLFANLYSYNVVSKQIDLAYGKVKHAIILIVSIIVGSLMVFACKDNTITVGLSAGIYGLFGAILVEYVTKGYFKVPQYRRGIIRTIYLNVIISLLPSVSLEAHIGGFVAGIVLGIIFNKEALKEYKIHTIICGIIIFGCLIYLAIEHIDFREIYFGNDKLVIDLLRKLGLNKTADNWLTKLMAYYTVIGG